MILGKLSNDIVSWNHYLLSFYDEYLIIYIDLIVNWELILCFHSFKLIHIMNNSKQTKKPFSLASVLFVLVTSCCYMRRQKNKCLSAFTFLLMCGRIIDKMELNILPSEEINPVSSKIHQIYIVMDKCCTKVCFESRESKECSTL